MEVDLFMLANWGRHGLYKIQHYVIKLVGDFLRVLHQ